MSNLKLYMNVPFAQKDQAKALGARWDPGLKKWYIPNGLDSAPFEKWKPEAIENTNDLPDKNAGKASPKSKPVEGHGISTIAITQPVDPNFAPYCGEEPPWNR